MSTLRGDQTMKITKDFDWSKPHEWPKPQSVAVVNNASIQRYIWAGEHQMRRALQTSTISACLFDGPRHGEVLHVPRGDLRQLIEYWEEPELKYPPLRPSDVYEMMPKYHVYRLKRLWPQRMAALYVYVAAS